MINIKVRLRNKTFLLLFIPMVLSFIYTLLSYAGVVPKISEDEVTHLLFMLIEILAMLGIVVDPTTKGVSDSDRAMTYDKPYELPYDAKEGVDPDDAE